MNRLKSFILAGVLTLTVSANTGCGDTDDSVTIVEENPYLTTSATNSNDEEVEQNKTNRVEYNDIVVYSSRDVKISLQAIEQPCINGSNVKLTFLVENLSDDIIFYDGGNIVIDGYQVSTDFEFAVEAGLKSVEHCRIYGGGLKECGIKQIEGFKLDEGYTFYGPSYIELENIEEFTLPEPFVLS